MSLKQVDFISNKFASKYHLSAHQGTTPGKFLIEYISRHAATEPLVLAPQDIKNMVWRAVLQRRALRAYANPQIVRNEISKNEGLNWRSFGRDSLSYSEKQLRSRSHRIQKLYDSGHSIGKLVVSFTVPYMKKRGLLDKNFHMNRRGEAFGQVDTLKLRMAFQYSMNRMLDHAHFNNPVWAAAIQFDTAHVHVHAVTGDDCPLSQSRRLVPASQQGSDEPYNHIPHYEDRGEFSQSDFSCFVHSMDYDLELQQPLEIFHSQPAENKKDLDSQVQMLASQQYNVNSYLQQLMISLPRDVRLWHYKSRQRIMKRPNQLMRGYLNSLIRHHGDRIGYNGAVNRIDYWAEHTRDKTHPKHQLIFNGVNKLYGRMAEDVYTQLRQHAHEHLYVRTPFMTQQAYDMDDMRALIHRAYQGKTKLQHPTLMMFSYRLNTYRGRYWNHARSWSKNRNSLDSFDANNDLGNIPELAQPLRKMFKSGMNYHGECLDKYRYLTHNQEVDPEQKRILREQRAFLIREYQQLRNNKPKPKRKPKPIVKHNPTPITQKLLGDDRSGISQVLSFHGTIHHKERQYSIRGNLTRLVNNDDMKVPPYMKTELSMIEQVYPEYKGLTHELNNRKVVINPTPVETAPQHSEANDNYAFQLSQFTDRAFEGKMLNSGEIMDYQEVRENPVKPPELHTPSVNLERFNQVKGVDVQDCLCDLTPGANRDVSPLILSEYDRTTKSRSATLKASLPYLRDPNVLRYQRKHSPQAINTVNQLQQGLRYQRHLNAQLQKGRSLPTDFPVERIEHDFSKRNQITFDLHTAHQYTRDHIDEISKDDHKFTEDLNNDPSSVLDTPSQFDNDDAESLDYDTDIEPE